MSAESKLFDKRSITFENGRTAETLHLKQPMDATSVLAALDLQPSGAAFLVCGSAGQFETGLKNRLLDLLSRGLAQAAVEHEALLIDEGFKDGVGELVGQGVADRGRKTPLIGVFVRQPGEGDDGLPEAVFENRDTNHSHFVTSGDKRPDWQTESMSQLAQAAALTEAAGRKHILTVLVGGELQGSALDLSLAAVRGKWPLVVIEGSGPLADKIVEIKQQQAEAQGSSRLQKRTDALLRRDTLADLQSTNPRLYEIVNDGDIRIISQEADATQLRKLVNELFATPHEEDVLWAAWQRFAEYDLNSNRHRDQWRTLKNWPLYLGVASTLIVLVYSATDTNLTIEGAQSSLWIGAYSAFMRSLGIFKTNPILDLIFRFVIILLPLSTSLLLAVETRLKLGSKYLLLRGAAEAVKRGIYSLRTLGKFDESLITDKRLPYNKQSLAEHISRIAKLLLESDVSEAAFKPYQGSIPPDMFGAEAYDDGFSDLDTETYVRIRIGDQLSFYTKRTNEYEKRIRSLQIWILVWGGIGTFLAAIGAQYWLPFTAAIVSAMTAFLEYRQIEQTLTKYNLTKSSLENARANWLSQPDRESPQNVQALVREVEAILESENMGWVQYVSQAQEPKEKQEEDKDLPPGMEGEGVG